MNYDDLASFMPQIRQIRFFNCLSEEQRSALLAISSIHDISAGDMILTQDGVGDALFFVLQGNVEVSIKDLYGKDVIISRLKRGEVFGEAAIFLSARRTATVVAASDTTVIRIRRSDLLSFFRNHPAGGNKILTLIILSLLKKIKITNEDLVLEKQSDIDFDYVDNLVQDFLTETEDDN